jgi:hypothetical protein
MIASFSPRFSISALVFCFALSTDVRAEQKISKKETNSTYPHATEAIGSVRQIYDGVLSPEMAVNTFRNIDRLFPTHTILHAQKILPLPMAQRPLSNFRMSDANRGGRPVELETFLELNRVAGLLVLKDGQIKLERYRYGNTEHTRWMSMSIAKSVTSTLIGIAIQQGKIASIHDPVVKYVPDLKNTAYQTASVRDVLMMASGVRWSEAYSDPRSDRRRLLEAQIAQQSGGAMAVMKSLPRQAEPGTLANYNTGETQIAAQVLRNAIGKSLASYLSEQIWSRFGMEADANWWLDSPDGVEIGGSGISATLRDYGRFGMFMLSGGVVDGKSVLPKGWAYEATTPKILKNGAPLQYGYLWWPAPDAQGQRDAAYAAIGIHGQYLYVNPATRVVIVVWGAQPKPASGAVFDSWNFFSAVSAALRD